jgi:two-component system, LytTR family, response regulator
VAIKVLIVDDEPLARERIRDLLERDPEAVVAGECSDGDEAVAAIRAHAPDVVFLDVQMPEKDGFDVVEEVGVDRLPAIVFVTAYDQYALRAFEVRAIDYLLKPFDEERFARTFERAKAQARAAGESRAEEIERRVLALVEEMRARTRTRYLDRLMIKSGGHLFFIKAEEIDWIEAEGNYVRLHVGDASHLLRETVAGLEAQLDPAQFLRIHRSTIVNLDSVREIQPLFHGEYRVVMQDGTKLTLSRGYRDRLSRFE